MEEDEVRVFDSKCLCLRDPAEDHLCDVCVLIAEIACSNNSRNRPDPTVILSFRTYHEKESRFGQAFSTNSNLCLSSLR